MATALTATVEAVYGRVQLQLTFTTVTSATVSRVHADGTVWPVRGANPTPVLSTSGVGAVIYDHEAPLDQAITYRASSGGTTFSSTAVTVPSDSGDLRSRVWLTHPLQPALSRLVTVTTVGARTRKGRSSVLPIAASSESVAITDRRLSPTGEIAVLTSTIAEATALQTLLDTGDTLCIRCPAFWGSWWFYAVLGDTTDEAAASNALDPSIEWKLPYSAVAVPAGTPFGPPGFTYADVNATYATYALLNSGEPSYAAVLT